MLAISSQQLNSTFERIVRGKNGVLVRVRFMIVEVNGSFQPKIISAEPVVQTEAEKQTSEVLYLPILNKAVKTYENFVQNYFLKLSPYSPLTFFMSQPTRAPSFR